VLSINLKHLYFFAEVARLGNITAAANSLNLSQPAITQAVVNVEKFFATTLLNRTYTGVTLTAAGQLCRTRAERAFIHLHTGMTELGKPLASQRKVHLFRSLTTSQVDALLAVVEHRNFSAASRSRQLAQPTIHRASRDLERLLDVPLFEKTSYGVVPTRDAERFARKIKLAFAEVAQARAEIGSLQGGESGRTVIGALPLARTFLLPSAVMQFSTEHPQHQVEIVEGTYNQLMHGLGIGEIDFVIGALRDSAAISDVVQEHLFDDPLSIILRADHSLLRKRRVTIATLARAPWVAPRPGSPLRDHYNQLFTAAGIDPPFASIECNSISAARALLLESDRLMLLSAHQVYYDLRAGLLKTLAPPSGKMTRSIGITTRRGWQPTNAQQALLEVVKEHARNLPRKQLL